MELITQANDAFLSMVGYSRDDLVAGRIDWMKMTPPKHAAKDMHALEQLKTQGFCTPFEKEYIHKKDGSRVPILVGVTVLNPSPLEWLAFVLDLSDLKRVEADLRKSEEELEQKVEERTQALVASLASLESEIGVRRKTEEQLHELSARLLRLQDEERRRIARDLHDSTGQTLSALKMTLASLASLIADVPKAPNLLSDLEALADQALQEIRTTSHLLYPPLLDEVGFSSAAQWYVDEFTKRSGLKTSLELSATPRLTKDAELVFFRVLQESLTNVIRHSGSATVDIGLCSDDENAVLSVRDCGRGIPSEKLNSFHETGAGVGVGLGGMKERVKGHRPCMLTGPSTRSREVLPAQKRCLALGCGFRRSLVRGCLLPLGLLTVILSAARTRAQDNYEIQVYGSDLVDPGYTMAELHSNFTIDGSKTIVDGVYPTNHAEHETVEITHGFNDWFECGFYIFTSITEGQNWQWVGVWFVKTSRAGKNFLPRGVSPLDMEEQDFVRWIEFNP